MDVIGTPIWKSAVDNVGNLLSRLRSEQAIENKLWNICRVGRPMDPSDDHGLSHKLLNSSQPIPRRSRPMRLLTSNTPVPV
jgi:hypothetical protein